MTALKLKQKKRETMVTKKQKTLEKKEKHDFQAENLKIEQGNNNYEEKKVNEDKYDEVEINKEIYPSEIRIC